MLRLVLLPGLNGNRILFTPLLSQLDPALEVEALCLPVQGSQDYDDLADALVDRLGDSPFVLLGESFSGPLAYRLALRQPTGLCGVIFAATFLRRPHPLLALQRYLPLRHKLLTHSSLLRQFCLDDGASPAMVKLLRDEIQALPVRLIRARLTSLNQLQIPSQQLDLPALHLLPRRDRLITHLAATTLRQHCRQLQQVTIDGPHFLLQSKPQDCAQAIQQFLAGLSAG
ncbi:alpha/beta fold hydrolase [Pseudomonas taeanensis]|jgi:surfactin synthase thioesterase subunit|uniref:alpha/beta fold hydrolase n=1 Tax=Pseudomonas taeanensis TaxID=574962 RepID=UPI0004B8D328|nr:alpha/beta fold hydrolase [Pseudomonas taeanensis]